MNQDNLLAKFPFPNFLFENKAVQFKKYTKFIIDTDAGCDDAHALICASYILKHYRQDAELVGITCVSGNATLENVIKNVYLTCRYSHFDVPPKIYKGCRTDILRRYLRDNFFGLDGLGGMQQKYLQELRVQNEPLSFFHEEQHAVDFIRDSVRQYGDELCIICIGPMTNVMLTMQLYPDIVEKVGAIFAMGGTYIGVGNQSNSVAEFNVMVDVESTAAVVMSPYNFKILLPFDVVLAYGCTDESGKKLYQSQQTKVAGFVRDIFAKVNFESGFYMCDQLAVMLALLPDAITYVLHKNIAIATDGMTRGQVIIDWFKKLNEKSSSQIYIVTAFDFNRLCDIAVAANQ